MPQSQDNKCFRFEKPAVYRIRVQGHLEENWTERLGVMSVMTTRSADEGAVTTLESHVADQAALSGLLNALYDLHLTLLSVECLDEKDKSVDNIK